MFAIHFYFAKHRVWWVTAFTLSIVCCGVSIQNIWQKWLETPIVIDLHEKENTIESIPFPMVTLCVETKFYKREFDVAAVFHSFKQSLANISDIEYEFLKLIILFI